MPICEVSEQIFFGINFRKERKDRGQVWLRSESTILSFALQLDQSQILRAKLNRLILGKKFNKQLY